MHNETGWKRNTALFLAGQGLTLFGSMLVHHAVMWHIVLQTKSSLMMTYITIAGTVPMFLISPFGGAWADRYNKKHIINIADGAIALVTLAMAVIFSMGYDSIGLMLLCLVMRALGQGVQMPAVNALIPQLVPQEHLTRVNGISGSIQSIVMFASPMVGGAVLAIWPIQTLMFVDVITAAIGISILLFFVKVTGRKGNAKVGAKQYFIEIGQGLKYVSKHSFARKFILLSAFFSLMIAPASVMTPLQVALDWGNETWEIFNRFNFGPELRLASVEVAFFVGMMIGGLTISLWGGFKNKSYTMALSTCMFAIGSIGLGLASNFWIYLICMGFSGLFISMFNAPMMSTMQTNIDPAFMGRVFSVFTMVSSLMMPLSMIAWGPLGKKLPIDWLLIGSGICLFLIGLVFLFDKSVLAAGIAKAPIDTAAAD